MSGDYSRTRFDPGADLSGVLMQQGRVQLDSDWNEWADILDRKLRAGSIDTFGPPLAPGIGGKAVVSLQTPDAFKIGLLAGGLTIGRGRMYVDGLLAENHGGGAAEFDPVLAELRGVAALAYDAQPWFPAPPALPGGGPHLAYLEVWQRELTWLQQPDLVDSAVGVDTTTRTQTVWQVRLLADTGDATCTTPDDAVAGWPALTRPSDGRMSIRAEGVPPALDPCELPPGGGYRGLENQLYRIEVHDGGAAGTATFKWSRDNASVASNVTEIVSPTELKLATLGRDAVLRFNTGDWVEILDDRRELSGENGDPALRRGVLRKITVDDARQTITFSPALPADLTPGGGTDTLDARHTRVQRWDQGGTVRDADGNLLVDLDAAGSSGLIPVPAPGVWVVLEQGIQVQFNLASSTSSAGGFHTGDYWVAAARTADTSVETYTGRPPRGIHRHYARLAIVTFPGDVTDCRVKWPPECGGCCTVNVAPGASIQAALDSLPEEGGCVCLKTGVHTIDATIRIRAPRIILKGESPGAIVRSEGLVTNLRIGDDESNVSDIVIDGIRFEATPGEADISPLLHLDGCVRVRVQHCAIAAVDASLRPGMTTVGILLNSAADIDLRDNRVDNVFAGIASLNPAGEVRIAGNAIAGRVGPFLDQKAGSLGGFGIVTETDAESPQACRVDNNRIRDFWIGIRLDEYAAGSLVAGNRISRSTGNTTDTVPDGIEQMRSYLDSRLYAIDIAAAQCEVRNNQIDLRSAAWGGIRVRGAHAIITANILQATVARERPPTVPAGIYCMADPNNGNVADHAIVRANRLLGPQFGIVVSRIAGPVVADNHIDASGGWFGVLVDDCSGSRIAGNDVREVVFAVYLNDGAGNHVERNRIDRASAGIAGTNEGNLHVRGNSLTSCTVFGIALYFHGALALLDNTVRHCGYLSTAAIGIAAYANDPLAPATAHLRIENCEVIDTGVSADGEAITSAGAIGIASITWTCQLSGNRVGYTQPDKLDPALEHRALVLIGPPATSGDKAMSGSAQVTGNYFHGPGRSWLVEFRRLPISDNVDFRFEKVSFSNNTCDHLGAAYSDSTGTVLLWGGHLIAMGNHIKADTRVNAFSLSNRDKIALMGNVTTGGYIDRGTVTPAPLENFNVHL